MTKTMIEGFGWVYVVVVLDWHSKKVVGHYAGLQARAWHWLVALNRAVNRQFPHGIEGQSLHLMADNGCQPTSLAFMRACADRASVRLSPATAIPRATLTPKGQFGDARDLRVGVSTVR
jgi:transposase InsO family protein